MKSKINNSIIIEDDKLNFQYLSLIKSFQTLNFSTVIIFIFLFLPHLLFTQGVFIQTTNLDFNQNKNFNIDITNDENEIKK